jgi:PAS domain S-box-containing protein
MTTSGLLSEVVLPSLTSTVATHSLRRRLPALIFALLGLLGAVFAWLAYHQVKSALRSAGGDRITAAAGQIADLLGQAASARMAEAKRLAGETQVQTATHSAREGLAPGVPPVLQAFVSRNPLTTVWLYEGTGQRTGQLARGRDVPKGDDTSAPRSAPPVGVSPFRSQGGHVWYHTTVPVPSAETTADPPKLLSIQRALGPSQAAGLIERLIGSGAVLKFGNASGTVWTDLSAPTTPPPVTTPSVPTAYVRDTGEKWVGVAVAITGTPWVVWVEVAEHTMLGPARTLLTTMVPITLVLMVFGAAAVSRLSGRITKPLHHLAGAAEAITAGDYTRRVLVDRRDEIGRLGTAFNVMAARVAESHDSLERRVAERTREVEQAREELDRFFSLSLDLLCIAGVDGRFRRVNPAWEQVLGWTPADLIATPYLDFVHPDDRAVTVAESSQLASGSAVHSFENRYRCRDGSYRWLSWKSVPLVTEGLIYAVAHDVTDERKSEQALHEHAAELASANRELEAFSYSVSHDLRAPLRHIDGFAQALAEDYADRLDTTGSHFISRIRAGAQRMGTLIDDLLSLSRVTRAPLTRTTLDLTSLVREIATRLEEDDPQRGVTWRIAPAVHGHGDAHFVRIALENLLGNAWKFTSKQADGVIEFSTLTSPDGERVYVVRDNGAGFDMAHAGKLFGAFQRLHAAADFPGTGIGLATVQRIVRRHGGRIWAEGSLDAGATLSFTLGDQ